MLPDLWKEKTNLWEVVRKSSVVQEMTKNYIITSRGDMYQVCTQHQNFCLRKQLIDFTIDQIFKQY